MSKVGGTVGVVVYKMILILKKWVIKKNDLYCVESNAHLKYY